MKRALCLLALAGALAAQKRPFGAETMWKLARISDPQLSPDGRTVAFVVETPDVEANTRPRQIWTVPLAGGDARKLTSEGDRNERPRWSPDGKRIAFVSNRGGSAQIWTMDPDGRNPRQVTRLATEASGVLWAGDGKNLVFVSSVYPDCKDEACNKARLESAARSQVKARVYTELLYRHWNRWDEGRRDHIFVIPAEGEIGRAHV